MLKRILKIGAIIFVIAAVGMSVSPAWREYAQLMFEVRDYPRGSPGVREIALIRKPINSKADTPAREWRLKFPGKFLRQELGSNADLYIVEINMDLQIETGELRPDSNAFTKDSGWTGYSIKLENREAPYLKKFVAAGRTDHCYDRQDIHELTKRPQPIGSSDGPRHCPYELCPVLMPYHGWSVEFLISKKEYLNKDNYCKFTSNLFGKWTISIDDLDLR